MDIDDYRQMIDSLDEQIIDLLQHRVQIAHLISHIKREKDLPMMDKKREQEILAHILSYAQEKGLGTNFVQELFKKIIDYSRKQQETKHDQ